MVKLTNMPTRRSLLFPFFKTVGKPRPLRRGRIPPERGQAVPARPRVLVVLSVPAPRAGAPPVLPSPVLPGSAENLRPTVSRSLPPSTDGAIQQKVPDSNKNSVFIGTYDGISCVSPISYDSLDRNTSITYSDSTPSVTFSYDSSSVTNGKGRRTGMSDAAGSSTFCYDVMGRTSKIVRSMRGAVADRPVRLQSDGQSGPADRIGWSPIDESVDQGDDQPHPDLGIQQLRRGGRPVGDPGKDLSV